MLQGWQGWWLSARFLSGINEFAWPPNNKVIDFHDPQWGFKKVPYEDTCVWILQISVYNYTWGNYDCFTASGYVCEIDMFWEDYWNKNVTQRLFDSLWLFVRN